jgi:hypothetical protein
MFAQQTATEINQKEKFSFGKTILTKVTISNIFFFFFFFCFFGLHWGTTLNDNERRELSVFSNRV